MINTSLVPSFFSENIILLIHVLIKSSTGMSKVKCKVNNGFKSNNEHFKLLKVPQRNETQKQRERSGIQ